MTDPRALLTGLAFSLAATGALAGDPPLPPPRPAEFDAGQSLVEPPEPPARPTGLDPAPAGQHVAEPAPEARPSPPPDDAACVALLASGHVRGERTAPSGDGACAIADGFTLRAVKLADDKEAPLDGGVTVRCAFAASVAQWVREDVAPRLAEEGATLQALSGVGGLECRTRNHQPGAKISEHARGAALDLRVLKTSAGAKDLTKADEATKALRSDMRRTACARFTTVLGPGSDSFHADHIHLDMAERRNGYRMCQWDIE